MNDPTVVEERGSERDLMGERFNRLMYYAWFIVEYGRKMRSSNLQHQHFVFRVWVLYLS